MSNESGSSAGGAKSPAIPQKAAHTKSEDMFRALLETAPDGMVVVNRAGWILLVNSEAEKLFGYKREEMLGRLIEMLVPQRFRTGHSSIRNSYFDQPRIRPMGAGLDLYALHKDGHEIPVEISLSPLETADSMVMISSIRDISERREAEDRIRKQQQALLEMATVPVVQVWDGIVMVPLIGTLDSQRAQQLMERLLKRVSETLSPVALVDITGVPTVDTQTAQHLIETISAVRLLGAEVVLTGVRPTIAQTLVHLGIDLSSILTRSSLSAGVRVAFELLNLKVATKAGAAVEAPVRSSSV